MENERKKKSGHSSRPSPDSDRNKGHDNAAAGEKLPPLHKTAGPPAFLKFSGIAFEMVATIGVATYGGYWLDSYLQLKFPVFLLSFAMLSLGGSLYLLYKRLPKD